MINLGKTFRKPINLDESAQVATTMLSTGKNKLNSANLQTLSPWQSAPVNNLVAGLQPNTNPLTQIGLGGKMSKFK